MPFLYYRRENGKLKKTGKTFSLAGYNLIYQLWEQREKPVDQGWHISADDLIRQYSNHKDSHSSAALIIDFDPGSKQRIGVIELLDIYVYTYSGATIEEAGWSPMMLRLNTVIYEEFVHEINDVEKEKKLNEITESDNDDDFVEFLYLNGSDRGWNWGMNGMTNAAFIEGPARDYFRQFF